MDIHLYDCISTGGNIMSKLKSYTIGFILSLLLTLIPYFAVTEKLWSGTALYAILAACAIAQVFVQLVFFLHLNHEKRPHWQRMAFGFMTVVVIIVVFGSLWIMTNLDYHMMPSHEVDTYIQDEEAITPHAHEN